MENLSNILTNNVPTICFIEEPVNITDEELREIYESQKADEYLCSLERFENAYLDSVV